MLSGHVATEMKSLALLFLFCDYPPPNIPPLIHHNSNRTYSIVVYEFREWVFGKSNSLISTTTTRQNSLTVDF